jgi:small subunit ribosomal protein S17
MSDETPETTEEQVEVTEAAEAAAPEAPAAEAQAPAADEAPAAEAETSADEAAAGGADAEQAPEPEPVPEPEAEAPAEPVTPLTPKERKVASRAARGRRRGATPEERAETRKAKAAARSRYRITRREKDRAKRSENPPEVTPPKEHGPGRAKERQGIVVSDKGEKTIVVRIDSARRHRRYQKIVRSSTTLHAHDERNEANEGDVVRVIESRPLSRTKHWRLVEILERAK